MIISQIFTCWEAYTKTQIRRLLLLNLELKLESDKQNFYNPPVTIITKLMCFTKKV